MLSDNLKYMVTYCNQPKRIFIHKCLTKSPKQTPVSFISPCLKGCLYIIEWGKGRDFQKFF